MIKFGIFLPTLPLSCRKKTKVTLDRSEVMHQCSPCCVAVNAVSQFQGYIYLFIFLFFLLNFSSCGKSLISYNSRNCLLCPIKKKKKKTSIFWPGFFVILFWAEDNALLSHNNLWLSGNCSIDGITIRLWHIITHLTTWPGTNVEAIIAESFSTWKIATNFCSGRFMNDCLCDINNNFLLPDFITVMFAFPYIMSINFKGRFIFLH